MKSLNIKSGIIFIAILLCSSFTALCAGEKNPESLLILAEKLCNRADGVAAGNISLEETITSELSENTGSTGSSSEYRAPSLLYNEAALMYESYLDQNGPNGAVYYNLGNASFRSGDTGKAVLSLLRAERFRPFDRNVKRNLNYIRSVRDRSPLSVDTGFLSEFKEGCVEIFPLSLQFIILIILNILFWAVLFVKRAEYLKIGRILPVLLGILVVISGTVSFISYTRSANTKSGVILASNVLPRKGDSLAYKPVYSAAVPPGTEFKWLERRNGWDLVEFMDNERGWVLSGQIGLVDHELLE